MLLMFLTEAVAIAFFYMGYVMSDMFVYASGFVAMIVSAYFHILYYFEMKFDELKQELKEAIAYGG
jgi:hypothetical protein